MKLSDCLKGLAERREYGLKIRSAALARDCRSFLRRRAEAKAFTLRYLVEYVP